MREIFLFKQHIKFNWKQGNLVKKFCSAVKSIPLCKGFGVHLSSKVDTKLLSLWQCVQVYIQTNSHSVNFALFKLQQPD